MKRLFFALCPDDRTRQQCVKIVNAIRAEKVSPVRPSNLHITLLFLGNTDPEKERLLKQALVAISAPKITLCFDQLSFWKKSGIICLTTTDISPETVTLADDLSRLARDLEIPIDNRPFKPHITLIKKAKKLRALEFAPIIWYSESFCLVESCPTPDGVEYRIIEQWETNNPQAQK